MFPHTGNLAGRVSILTVERILRLNGLQYDR